MKSCYVPSKEIQKIKYTNPYSKEQNYMLYKLTEKDLTLDARPKQMLFNKLNHDFYVNPPLNDEGLCLSNTEAGIRIEKIKKELKMQKLVDGLVIKKQNLREKIIQTKEHTKNVRHRK